MKPPRCCWPARLISASPPRLWLTIRPRHLPLYDWHHAAIVPQSHPAGGRNPAQSPPLAEYPLVTYHERFTGDPGSTPRSPDRTDAGYRAVGAGRRCDPDLRRTGSGRRHYRRHGTIPRKIPACACSTARICLSATRPGSPFAGDVISKFCLPLYRNCATRRWTKPPSVVSVRRSTGSMPTDRDRCLVSVRESLIGDQPSNCRTSFYQ